MFDSLKPLAESFKEAGFDFYVVGGCVRDAVLGQPSDDIDVCTDALPPDIKDILELNDLSRWTQGEKFGTIGTKIDNIKVEITTYRNESYDPDSRKPKVTFSDSLLADVQRRDFTINTIAYNPLTNETIDLLEGQVDLEEKLLRTPLDSEVSFSDDPLRLMRAARFIAKYNLEIEHHTFKGAQAVADQILKVSTERIQMEFEKILLLPDPMPALNFLEETGVRKYILPSHFLEKFFSEPEITLRLAEYFFGQTTQKTREWLNRLRFSNKVIKDVMSCHYDSSLMVTDAYIRQVCDMYGQEISEKVHVSSVIDEAQCKEYFLRRGEELSKTEPDLFRLRPVLTGDEVMGLLKIPAGQDLGSIMEALLQDRVEHGLRTKEEAIHLLLEGYYGD